MEDKTNASNSTHQTRKIIFLVAAIFLLMGGWYFVKLTYTYYTGVKDGTLDLSGFTQQNSTTQIEEDIEITSTSNFYVDNFLDDPSIGPRDAALTVVMFEDFECPFCGEAFPAVRKAIDNNKATVRFVYRDFPITSIHANAQKAAEAGACAHAQGQFWAYHDKLFVNQDSLDVGSLKRYARELNLDVMDFDNCLDSGTFAEEVQQDYEDGLRAGVRGTPTFFFNGNRVAGVITEDGFEQIIAYFID